MSLAEIYLYAAIIGFLWLVGTASLGLASTGASQASGSGGGDLGDIDPAVGGSIDGPAEGGDPGNADAATAVQQMTNDCKGALALPANRINPILLILKLLSPSTISTFSFFFGLTGCLLLHFFPGLGLVSLAIALIAGVAGYQSTSAMTSWMAARMHVSASYKHEHVIGREAEITVPIPPGGLGEVTYLASGIRDTAPARGINSSARFDKGQTVVLCDVQDGIFYVEPFAAEPEWGTTSDTRDKLQKH